MNKDARGLRTVGRGNRVVLIFPAPTVSTGGVGVAPGNGFGVWNAVVSGCNGAGFCLGRYRRLSVG